MSEIFHKSCYTSRSSGYKYRTLATNTGEFKRWNIKEDNTLEKKFRELRRAIVGRVNKELSETHKARESIIEKFEKIDAKINSMLELQNTVTALRKDLYAAGYSIMDMVNKVEFIENINNHAEMTSLQSQRTSIRSQAPIIEEREDQESILTHI